MASVGTHVAVCAADEVVYVVIAIEWYEAVDEVVVARVQWHVATHLGTGLSHTLPRGTHHTCGTGSVLSHVVGVCTLCTSLPTASTVDDYRWFNLHTLPQAARQTMTAQLARVTGNSMRPYI